MINFKYEDDCLWCNNEKSNENHNTRMLIEGKHTIEYDIEYNVLTNERVINLSPEKIYAVCLTCDNKEEITDYVEITKDEPWKHVKFIKE